MHPTSIELEVFFHIVINILDLEIHVHLKHVGINVMIHVRLAFLQLY